MENETSFRPTQEMEDVLEEARRQLWEMKMGDLFKPLDPHECCVMIGLPGAWERWLEDYGDALINWFVRGIQPTALERGVIDALFWKSLRRVLNTPKPTAAHLRLAAELGGHLKERPEPPPIPHLTAQEALDVLRKLGIDVLEQALEGAQEDDEKRRSVDEEDSEPDNMTAQSNKAMNRGEE